MKPSIGRIVLYATTDQDQRMIGEHPHNTPQEYSPAMIVAIIEDAVEADPVNLKVFVDGYGELYKKAVERGDGPGKWNWPSTSVSISVADLMDSTSKQNGDIDIIEPENVGAIEDSLKIVESLLKGYVDTEQAGIPTEEQKMRFSELKSKVSEIGDEYFPEQNLAPETEVLTAPPTNEGEAEKTLLQIDHETGKLKDVAPPRKKQTKE